MNTHFHFDGHGLNDSNGTRILTFAKKHADEGGGYIMDRESMALTADFIVRACNAYAEIMTRQRAHNLFDELKALDLKDTCKDGGRYP